jgi:hypothetical protein
MATKMPKWQLKYQMVMKDANNFHPKASQSIPKSAFWHFWYENVPSGNPASPFSNTVDEQR